MDDLEFEEWDRLTDEQQEAIVQREEARYFRWLDSLSPDQRYAYHRGKAVENCLRWRKIMREHGMVGEFWTGMLRQRQIRLVKLRAWRATGVYPGTA